MKDKELLKKQTWKGISLVLIPLELVLIWNIFGVHSALGLPTVNVWTAYGVFWITDIALGYFSYCFWWGKDENQKMRNVSKLDWLRKTKI